MDKNLIITPTWPQWVICIWKHGEAWGMHDGDIHGYYRAQPLQNTGRLPDGNHAQMTPILTFRSIEQAERYLEERPKTWTSGSAGHHKAGFKHSIEPICSIEHYEHRQANPT